MGKLKEAGGVGAVGAVGPGLQGGVVGQKGKLRNGQLVKLYDVQFTMSYYTHALDVNNNSFANYPSDRFEATSSPSAHNLHDAHKTQNVYQHRPFDDRSESYESPYVPSYASSYARAKSTDYLPYSSPHRPYHNHQPSNHQTSPVHPSLLSHHFQKQKSSSSAYFNELSLTSNGDFSPTSLFTKSTSNLNSNLNANLTENLNEKERRRRYFLFSEN